VGHDWYLDALYEVLAKETSRLGLWRDSSEQTPEETVRAILARSSSG
jgi:hypothetical protein